jgi:predicted phosphodiesterase
MNGTFLFGLEDLFQKHQVDVVFSGHTHHYER